MLSNTTVSSLVDIDRPLCNRISSIGVPVGELPCTLDTIKPLLKHELQSCVIHEGVSNTVQEQFKTSIFNQIVPRTKIEVESLKLIKYNRLAGPDAYTSKGWKFNRRKQVKRTEECDSETDGLEDDEGSATEIDGDDNDNDDDVDDSTDNGSGSKLNYEDTFNAQKPDLSLFDFALLKEKKSWANVLAFMEHTSSDLSKNRGLAVYWGSAIKAYLIMREQPWCRFVLVYSICANMLRSHYFDHSGIIISLPFNIHKSPGSICLCDALAALTLPDNHYLGLDPTIHMCHAACNGTHVNLADGAIGWVEDNKKNVYSIMAVLWKSHGFFCRGTVCYHVRNKEGKEYALKDCWVEESWGMHKPTVLRMLKGVPNIVELIDDWDVYYEGQPDCMVCIHEKYDQDQQDDTAFCN
ncbi:uncharacterized protein EDB93DRAFT_1257066 [Suillus bovinus]|uniref:uncharacterized protein n=1 Tax=Suillus bovinus TaxID=48563 RepID=UPI001B8751FA|nr:uncharacterized protein EDB93DRAFT_1257066 [Suillus bovinus]KAG2127313.1 hypothetical protein EDB93DRAFT_1257066 [Suillus bovinus]